MDKESRSFSELLKEIRRQLALSQEDLARQLGVSYATVNRWENNLSKPSKLAKTQFALFFEKMTKQGSLRLPEYFEPAYPPIGLPVKVQKTRAGG